MSLRFSFLGIGFEDEKWETLDNINTQEVAPFFNYAIMLLNVECIVGDCHINEHKWRRSITLLVIGDKRSMLSNPSCYKLQTTFQENESE